MTHNPINSVRAHQGHALQFAECDDITFYTEGGWWCAMGWKNGRCVIHVHASSMIDRDKAIGKISKNSNKIV